MLKSDEIFELHLKKNSNFWKFEILWKFWIFLKILHFFEIFEILNWIFLFFLSDVL